MKQFGQDCLTTRGFAPPRALGLTQAGTARRMGLAMRSYQDIEKTTGEVKARHVAMAERVALSVAVETKNPMLASIAYPSRGARTLAPDHGLTQPKSLDGSALARYRKSRAA